MGEGASFVLQKKAVMEPTLHRDGTETSSQVAEDSVAVPLLNNDAEVRSILPSHTILLCSCKQCGSAGQPGA